MSHLKTASPAPSSVADNKRKREETNVVYSQPQETGTGSHIYTQLTYTITWLRNRMADGDDSWHSLKEIMDYLNVHDPTMKAQLQTLYRSRNPTNRIAYNQKDGTYRYKPIYDIRNANQLKGFLQNQKSAQGISVKDLKDGWPTVHNVLKIMEGNKEVLIKRNLKDQVAKTVWGNDATLMHDMDPEFQNEWHKIQIPPNPDDLRNALLAAGLKPSSAPRQAEAKKTDKKRKKAVRRGGKQTNAHMANILKDFSHMRK
jgi:transcription initiation factor TFIIE subunit beta